MDLPASPADCNGDFELNFQGEVIDMKKLLSFALLACFLLTACGEDAENALSDVPPEPEPTEITTTPQTTTTATPATTTPPVTTSPLEPEASEANIVYKTASISYTVPGDWIRYDMDAYYPAFGSPCWNLRMSVAPIYSLSDCYDECVTAFDVLEVLLNQLTIDVDSLVSIYDYYGTNYDVAIYIIDSIFWQSREEVYIFLSETGLSYRIIFRMPLDFDYELLRSDIEFIVNNFIIHPYN